MWRRDPQTAFEEMVLDHSGSSRISTVCRATSSGSRLRPARAHFNGSGVFRRCGPSTPNSGSEQVRVTVTIRNISGSAC